jgi:hypothetical protein
MIALKFAKGKWGSLLAETESWLQVSIRTRPKEFPVVNESQGSLKVDLAVLHLLHKCSHPLNMSKQSRFDHMLTK